MSNNRAFTLLESLIALIILIILIHFILQLLYFYRVVHQDQNYYLDSVIVHLHYEFALALDIVCHDNEVEYIDKNNTMKLLTLSKHRLVRTGSGFEILISDVQALSCHHESMQFRHRDIEHEIRFKP